MAMSVSDITCTIARFLGTWMIPAHVDNPHVIVNCGAQGTCSLQGLLVTTGLMASPLFATCCCWFCLLMVRCNWKDFHLQKIEKWAHGSIWIFVLAMSTFPMFLGLCNANCDLCWIQAAPLDCGGDDDFTGPCVRGQDAQICGLVFAVFPAWGCLLAVIIIVASICAGARKEEKQAGRCASSWMLQPSNSGLMGTPSSLTLNSISPSPSPNRAAQPRVNRSKSKSAAWQAFWHAAAFIVTHFLALVCVTWWQEVEGWNAVMECFACGVLMPLQGFWDCLVCVRRRDKMKTPEGRWIRTMLCCCCPTAAFAGPPRQSKNTISTNATMTLSQHPPAVPLQHDECEQQNPVLIQREQAVAEQEAALAAALAEQAPLQPEDPPSSAGLLAAKWSR